MLSSRLSQFAAQLEARVDAALAEGAKTVAEAAKQRAPDAPPLGQGLVEAIHVEEGGFAYDPKGGRRRHGAWVRDDTGVQYSVVAGDKKVFWGHMVEHGTSHSAPHPFLVPALEESREGILRSVKAALK